MSFRITFGIRPAELAWKHRLNGVIAKRQKDIDRILDSYGVPLLPDIGRRGRGLGRAVGAPDDAQ